MGLKYAVSAGILLANPTTRILDTLELIFAFVPVLIILPILAWKFTKLPKNQRQHYFEPESFVADTLKESMKKSWGVLFILLIFMELFADNLFANMPPKFFIQIAISVMLVVVSLTFFYLNWGDNNDDYAGA
jgi:hypothetical protein